MGANNKTPEFAELTFFLICSAERLQIDGIGAKFRPACGFGFGKLIATPVIATKSIATPPISTETAIG